MVHLRSGHACTIFNSMTHNDRPLAIVAGGFGGDTAEIWDFTLEGTSWKLSKFYFQYLKYTANTSAVKEQSTPVSEF